MLLAGGRGKRLQTLTQYIAKPVVPFGGKYRIIDFVLSNCRNSNITTIGVLTQYQPHLLQNYIGNGQHWNLNTFDSTLTILPPFQSDQQTRWYEGTASAIYPNIHFIEQHDPEHVLILSGDHIYKMDYNDMLKDHIESNADVTISVVPVPWNEASRFGIMNLDKNNRITEFEEKPQFPRSNLASMGIYIFKKDLLLQYLESPEKNGGDSKDFGMDIIPALLSDSRFVYAHKFEGYWKDVGTIDTLWEANMDLLNKLFHSINFYSL